MQARFASDSRLDEAIIEFKHHAIIDFFFFLNVNYFSRFKIDDRFKDNKEEPSEDDSDSEDDDVSTKRRENLVLKGGVEDSEEKQKKKGATIFKDNSNMRFDPTR